MLYRQWKQQDPVLPALSAIYRALQRHDLNQRSRHYLMRQAIGGPTKAFEVPLVNELWMVDFSPGPFLHLAGQKKATATHLCAILDDHSRVLPHAAYYLRADTRCFHCSFKEAIRRRGVPRKLYTDQGGPFINDHTRVICANLGIRLLHAKPYHAWSKGKIERFFHTVQQDFEALLRLPAQSPATLEELNARLADWIQSVYHVRTHEGIGMSPQERFARGSARCARWIRTWTWSGSSMPSCCGWCARTAPCASTTTSTKWTWPCVVWRCVCALTLGVWREWKWIIGAKALAWPAR